MCLIPGAGSAADSGRMLIARLRPLQERKPGSISYPLDIVRGFGILKENILLLRGAVFCRRVQRVQLEIAKVFGVLI